MEKLREALWLTVGVLVVAAMVGIVAWAMWRGLIS